MSIVPYELPARGSNLLTAFNEAARGWSEHAGFDPDEINPQPLLTPDQLTRRRRRRKRFRRPQGAMDYTPERSETGNLRGSRTSGTDGTTGVGAEVTRICKIGEPNTALLPYPRPALTNLGDSMGYGLRTHVHVYCKGAKICRLFWRDLTTENRSGGRYIMHYCLIQMLKDKTIDDVIDGEPPTGWNGQKVYEKFFRDYSESEDTWRTFENEELYPQTESDFKQYKNCNNINPNNGMFKLLMRKRFVLDSPSTYATLNPGMNRLGTKELKIYKRLPHKVTWEAKGDATPERPIYELWWGYPENPTMLANVTGSIHYKTLATNTMYFKDIGHA